MKKPISSESASALIDRKIEELGDWRGKTLAKVRERSRGGIVCTGETYKNHVKMTFAKGAALKDPAGLFNSSLDGSVAAVALNLK